MSDQTTVDVQSAWLSKINWTQAVGVGATILAVVSGHKYEMPVETQLAIVSAIQGVQAVATWVARTWFTTTVTPASVGGAK